MSLVLKSNTTALNFILDKFGIFSTLKWSFVADFSRGEYISNGQSVPLSSVLTTKRNIEASVFDKYGVDTLIAKDTPRISYNPKNGCNGLLLESKGLLYEFKNPTSGVKTLAKLLPFDIWCVEVVGSGSVDLSAANIVNKSGVATGKSPAYIASTGSGSFEVTMTVTGEVSLVVVTTQMIYPTENTPKTGNVRYSRSVDEVITLNTSSAIKNTDYTYLVAFYPNQMPRDVMSTLDVLTVQNAPYLTVPLFSLETKDRWANINAPKADSKALEIGFRFVKGNPREELTITYLEGGSSVKTLILVDYNVNKPLIMAVSCSSGGYRIAHNGQCTELLTGFPPVVFDEIAFGVSKALGQQVRPNGVFEKVATFNRSMSRAELEDMTRKTI